MTFIKFVFYKIYSFYSHYWPDKGPEVYAYFATVFLISMNFISLHFAYLILTNPAKSINVYFGLVIMGFCSLLVYTGVISGGKFKALSAKDFTGYFFNGVVGSIFIAFYTIASLATVIILASLVRQYHI